MTQHNLTQILKVIRDLVMRNRPCYRDYLGSETVTKTVQIGSGVFEDNGGTAITDFPATDSAFTGFVLGETYTVTIDGVTADYVARNLSPISEETGPIIGTTTTFDTENHTFDGWFAASANTPEALVCMAQTLDMSFIGKTISISQTKTETVKRYNTKLLPEYLLPAFLRKNVVASKAEVQSAAAKATAAEDAANAAQNTANAAQNAAYAAQNAANAAQNTANTAKSTADAAQTTADAALPKSGGELSGPIKTYSGISFPCNILPNASRTGLYISSSLASKVLTNRLESTDIDVSIYSYIETIVTYLDGISIHNPNKITNGKTVTIVADGERLDFSGIIGKKPITISAKDIILSSSTADSTKRFRIAVDDTGTLKATEVTS